MSRDKGAKMEGEAIREVLRQWHQAHPQATCEEIEDAVQQQVAQLHASLMDERLASAAQLAGEGAEADRLTCPSGGGRLRPSGRRGRAVVTRLGQRLQLERAYYVCPTCGVGRFPPG